jgi:hypothetical protein
MPFYRTMFEQNKGAGSKTRIVVAAAEPLESLREYLQRNGLHPDGMTSAVSRRIKGTPTAVLLDSKSRVRRVWEGMMNPQSQAELLRLLAETST